MNGTNRGAIRAYAAFSNDLIDLIVKDYPLDLFEDPFPILEAQPDPVRAGHPVWSRNAVKLMSALLPVVEGRFDCNPYVHGSPPYKELTLAQARSPTTTPMFCPLPLRERELHDQIKAAPSGNRQFHASDLCRLIGQAAYDARILDVIRQFGCPRFTATLAVHGRAVMAGEIAK